MRQNDNDCLRKVRQDFRKSEADPLDQAEVQWIRAFVPLLILRVAEVESGAKDLRQITMSDMPDL